MTLEVDWRAIFYDSMYTIASPPDCSVVPSTLVLCGVQEVKANKVKPHLHPEIEDRKHNNPMYRKTLSSLRNEYNEFNEKESSHL